MASKKSNTSPPSLPSKLMHPIPLARSFFTAIRTQTEQLFDCGLNNFKLPKMLTTVLTFFKLLRNYICFPKISKSTHTVNLYYEFPCKRRFPKVDFAITSYLWKSNLTFLVSGIDRPCFLAIKNKAINNIYLT